MRALPHYCESFIAPLLSLPLLASLAFASTASHATIVDDKFTSEDLEIESEPVSWLPGEQYDLVKGTLNATENRY